MSLLTDYKWLNLEVHKIIVVYANEIWASELIANYGGLLFMVNSRLRSYHVIAYNLIYEDKANET